MNEPQFSNPNQQEYSQQDANSENDIFAKKQVDYTLDVEKYTKKFNNSKSLAGIDRVLDSVDNWLGREFRKIERRQNQIHNQVEALDGDIEEELQKAEELENENIALSRQEDLLDAAYNKLLEIYDTNSERFISLENSNPSEDTNSLKGDEMKEIEFFINESTEHDETESDFDKMVSILEAEQEELVQELAPKLVDILNGLGTDKFEGTYRTIEFNKEENQLSLVENTLGEVLMKAQWNGDENRWVRRESSLTKTHRDMILDAVDNLHQEKGKTKELGLG